MNDRSHPKHNNTESALCGWLRNKSSSSNENGLRESLALSSEKKRAHMPRDVVLNLIIISLSRDLEPAFKVFV